MTGIPLDEVDRRTAALDGLEIDGLVQYLRDLGAAGTADKVERHWKALEGIRRTALYHGGDPDRALGEIDTITSDALYGTRDGRPPWQGIPTLNDLVDRATAIGLTGGELTGCLQVAQALSKRVNEGIRPPVPPKYQLLVRLMALTALVDAMLDNLTEEWVEKALEPLKGA